MNKQTLSYHTRLHEWYRLHCINIEEEKKQQQTQHQPHKQRQITSKQQEDEDDKHPGLSGEKIYSIDEWCSEVNRTLFRVKKKETSPLYRKYRLNASTKSVINSLTSKKNDPRRVRSAEVFTRTGHWAKQHKMAVNGGELLSSASTKNLTSEKDANLNNNNVKNNLIGSRHRRVEFCVTNSSTEKNVLIKDDKNHPRVNHDSFNIRNNPVSNHRNTTKSDKLVDKSAVLPSKFIPESLKFKPNRKFVHHEGNNKEGHKVKTVTVGYVINNLVMEETITNQNTKTQSDPGIMKHNSLKTGDDLPQKRIFSASQKSVKTDINSCNLGDYDHEGKAALNAAVKFCEEQQDDVPPTFCNTCSGFYSGQTPPPPTPATCANCVHGINLNGAAGLKEKSMPPGRSYAEIQKELSQRLMKNEKLYGEKLENAAIALKLSEARLIDDGLYYNAERDLVTNTHNKSTLSLPNTLNDAEEDRNMSVNSDQSMNAWGSNKLNNTASMSDISDNSRKDNNKSTEGKVVKAIVTINDASIIDINVENDENINNTINDDPELNAIDEKEDMMNLKARIESFNRRGSRRQSISFTYKPQVSSISQSNNLLRVISIDDCKMGMRYNPHKVLEDHEITDNPITEKIKKAMGKFTTDSDDLEIDQDSQLAMRLSQNSSMTSLQSSSFVNDVTDANKLQYKILFTPDDLNVFNNKLRPKSGCLTKAFDTMINDRTVMQKMDKAGNKMERVKNPCTIAKSIEGPKYKIINTALKREMGSLLQAQKHKLLQKYELQKKCGRVVNLQRAESRISGASSKSISLHSKSSISKAG